MFEVGKKYHSDNGPELLCIATHGNEGWLQFPTKGLVTIQYSNLWKEVKVPIIVKRWVNIYPDVTPFITYPSKEEADTYRTYTRIACVELTGEYFPCSTLSDYTRKA